MTTTTVSNWLAAMAIAIAMGAAYHLDGPGELQAMADTTAATVDGINAAAAEARFTRAAAQACGNAPWAQDAAGAIVCKARKGPGTGPGRIVVAQAGAEHGGRP